MSPALIRRRTVQALIAGLVIVVSVAGYFWLVREPPVIGETAVSAVPGGMQPDSAAMLLQLAAHLEKNPRDSRAWIILARMHFDRDAFAQARAAYARALAIPGKVAEDPMVWCEYADAVAMANGGRLAGEPRQHIEKALALNPGHPRALEMAGSAEIEQGNFRAALGYWEPLLKLLPPESPAYRELSAAVERTRMRAGL